MNGLYLRLIPVFIHDRWNFLGAVVSAFPSLTRGGLPCQVRRFFERHGDIIRSRGNVHHARCGCHDAAQVCFPDAA